MVFCHICPHLPARRKYILSILHQCWQPGGPSLLPYTPGLCIVLTPGSHQQHLGGPGPESAGPGLAVIMKTGFGDKGAQLSALENKLLISSISLIYKMGIKCLSYRIVKRNKMGEKTRKTIHTSHSMIQYGSVWLLPWVVLGGREPGLT